MAVSENGEDENVTYVMIKQEGLVKDAGEEVPAFRIEVLPARDALRPDLPFLHQGELFEDAKGATYEILDATLAQDLHTGGYVEGLSHTYRFSYLCRTWDGR
jgi:hypothetical protein